MQDRLIDYLLNALDGDEASHVERLLRTDEEARRQLERLRPCLELLAADKSPVEAPTELVQRTCQQIRQLHRSPREDS
jgi:anti-sigma-K factor RskA